MSKFIIGAFLAFHGLIHLGYLTPAPTTDPNYPFRLNKSWLITSLSLGEPMVRLLGIVFSIIAVVGFVLAGLAAIGIIVPPQLGLSLTVTSAIASLALLILFWHPWLVLGVAIDVLLVVGLLWLNWQPFGTSGV